MQNECSEQQQQQDQMSQIFLILLKSSGESEETHWLDYKGLMMKNEKFLTECSLPEGPIVRLLSDYIVGLLLLCWLFCEILSDGDSVLLNVFER